MTRIAGVPEALLEAAGTLALTGPELELAARALGSAPLPEMPPGVAGAVAECLAGSSATLGRAAAIAAREAGNLRRRGLWLQLADALFGSWAVSSPFRAASDIPIQILDLVGRRRAFQMAQVWNRYESAVVPIVQDYGETSMQATKMWLLFQRDSGLPLQRLNATIDGAGELDAYERASAVPLQFLRDVSGKVLGPVGVVGGLIQMGFPEHHGLEGVGDRAAGFAGAAGSAIGTGIAYYGLEATAAMIPGADLIVAGLLIGSAGWDVYTHKREIAHAVVAAGRFLLDHKALVLVGPAGAAAQAIWDHRQQVARAAVAAAAFGEHRAEDAAKLAVSVAGSGLHDLESGGSAVLHAGGSVVHDAGSVASGAMHEGGKLLGKIGL